jgi:hypothetical protein
MAQIHRDPAEAVPNSLPAHSTPELDIFGMQGVPPEDLQRHYDGLPIVPYKRSGMGEAGLVTMLAAQKAALSGNPLPMSAHVPMRQVQVLEGIGPSQAIPHLPRSDLAGAGGGGVAGYGSQMPYYGATPIVPTPPSVPILPPQPHLPTYIPPASTITAPVQQPSPDLPHIPITPSFTPFKISATFDQKTGKRQPASYVMIADVDVSPEEKRSTLTKYKFTIGTIGTSTTSSTSSSTRCTPTTST